MGGGREGDGGGGEGGGGGEEGDGGGGEGSQWRWCCLLICDPRFAVCPLPLRPRLAVTVVRPPICVVRYCVCVLSCAGPSRAVVCRPPIRPRSRPSCRSVCGGGPRRVCQPHRSDLLRSCSQARFRVWDGCRTVSVAHRAGFAAAPVGPSALVQPGPVPGFGWMPYCSQALAAPDPSLAPAGRSALAQPRSVAAFGPYRVASHCAPLSAPGCNEASRERSPSSVQPLSEAGGGPDPHHNLLVDAASNSAVSTLFFMSPSRWIRDHGPHPIHTPHLYVCHTPPHITPHTQPGPRLISLTPHYPPAPMLAADTHGTIGIDVYLELPEAEELEAWEELHTVLCRASTQWGLEDSLRFQLLRGDSLLVEVQLNATVHMLGLAIELECGIPVAEQSLTYGDRPLRDAELIRVHNVGRDSTVLLMLGSGAHTRKRVSARGAELPPSLLAGVLEEKRCRPGSAVSCRSPGYHRTIEVCLLDYRMVLPGEDLVPNSGLALATTLPKESSNSLKINRHTKLFSDSPKHIVKEFAK